MKLTIAQWGLLLQAQQAMIASSERLASAVSELVGKSQQEVALPAAPDLPQAVLEQAPQVLGQGS